MNYDPARLQIVKDRVWFRSIHCGSAGLSRKHILIETQVFPYDVSGRLKDGHYQSRLFDRLPSRREGRSTELALVSSLNTLLFLRAFGFQEL
jgi:tRNA (mo5U34)-methyltransferase